MGFIDSYKHLEKLCGDMLNDDRRVSAYIDEMLDTPRGAYLVTGWNEDLKMLKHYRWVRNRIVHDYENVDLSVLWGTIQESLPSLKDNLKDIILNDLDFLF